MAAQTTKIINDVIGENHMVYKTQAIKTLNFEEVSAILYLSEGSQPFIGDINGDQIDDILFNNGDDSAITQRDGKLQVAIYNIDTHDYEIGSFREKMVDPECGGKQSKITKPELTTPHSVSMIDFDGDCLSDFFLTVQEQDQPNKKYYEIYIRREQWQEDASPDEQKIDGLNSFCLVQYDDISNIPNNQIFEFADIDRDGMVDMLFITDRRNMNFIVNYNMLDSPSVLAEIKKQENRRNNIDQDAVN